MSADVTHWGIAAANVGRFFVTAKKESGKDEDAQPKCPLRNR